MYASASIKPFRSAGLAISILMIQPSPYGSLFTRRIARIAHFCIEFQHLSRYRHKKVGGGFYRFNGAENFVRGYRFAYGFHFDVDEFAEFALGIIGDADVCDVAALDADPLVVFCVFAVGRKGQFVSV